ncbi:MAG: hypothetical protein AAB229_05235 [Candidatus Hydrogenedentota bacterium]
MPSETPRTIAPQAFNSISHDAAYAYLISYFMFRFSGRTAQAERALERAAALCQHERWPYPMVRYLQLAITDRVLLNLAVSQEMKTGAHALLALSHRLNNHYADAALHKNWVERHAGSCNGYVADIFLALLRKVEFPAQAA